MSLMKPGDSIIADRDFEIDDLLPENVLLNMPPFLFLGYTLNRL